MKQISLATTGFELVTFGGGYADHPLDFKNTIH
jgi:hypothetical protein